MARSRSKTILAALFLALVVGCAVNPATGRREIALISESREIEMGRGADVELSASLGLIDDPGLQTYVSDLGLRLAAASERPSLPWTFRVVDDPTVNAFALPGGFIYVTRGILTRFDSEAELVGVLGHEVGHVTARHSVTQMSRQQIQQIGLGVGMIFSEDFRRVGGAVSAAVQMVNLGYSRGDESQSDELGLRYMNRIAYDGSALIGVFQMLAGVSGGGGERLPEWQLTHPYPENREADIRALIAASGAPTNGTVNRDAYLDRIDGLEYGEDPREGYFLAERFVQPDMAFEMRFPVGWTGVNQRSLVAGVSPEQDAVVMLEIAAGASDPASALQAFLAQEGIAGGRITEIRRGEVDEARAPFSVATEQGTVRGVVAFLSLGGRIYRIMGYSSESLWASHQSAASATIDSFARLTDRQILDVQPWRLRIVRVGRETTLQSLYDQWNPPISLEALANLNRVAPGATIPAGSRVKRVEGRPFR